MISELITGILGNIVWLILGVVSSAVFFRFSIRSRYKALLGFGNPEEVIVILPTPVRILPGTKQTRVGVGVPLTPSGAVHGHSRISSLLKFANTRDYEVATQFSGEVNPEALSKNLVSIGIPITNEVTRDIFARLDLPIAFEKHSIIDSRANETYLPELNEDNEVTKDYGFLAWIKSPYANGKKCILMGGVQTYGIVLAASLLSEHNLGNVYFGGRRSFIGRWLSSRVAQILFRLCPPLISAFDARDKNRLIIIEGEVFKNEIFRSNVIANYEF